MHSINEMAIRMIEDDLRRAEKNTTSPYSVIEFAQDSYCKTTYLELIDLLKKNKDMPPIVLIEDYVKKMEKYSCANEFSSFMFAVSHDVAEYVLDELNYELKKWRKE